MDRMYRYQRYFYDLTRKYYLIGRDKLITEMPIKKSERVLEVGCGTARNLVALARKFPNANFYGLDASSEMLRTAQAKIDAAKVKNITLQTALADEFSYQKTFDLPEPFDWIFFSYAVSIIPPWEASIENALDNLKSGKSLYIVDFYDQKDLPVWFQKILQKWLEQFHVKYPEQLLPFLESLEKKGLGKLRVEPLYRRYALIAEFKKS